VITAVVNTKAVAALQARLSLVASGDTAREIQREVAKDINKKLDRQFAVGRDPYGRRWPRPKAGNKPGVRTGDLMRAKKAVPAGNRILLRAPGVPYAIFFQRSRGIFPDAGVPPAWRESIDRISRNIVRRKLRAGR